MRTGESVGTEARPHGRKLSPLRSRRRAVLPAGCRLERLGVELTGRPELADALPEIRRTLDRASTSDERKTAHARLDSLLPRNREE